jgi:hypothetical protein
VTPDDEPIHDRASRPRHERASTPSGSGPGASTPGALAAPASQISGPGAVDSDPFFSELLPLSDLPELDAILPQGGTAAELPPRLSPEIETLLAEAAAHVRDLQTRTAVPEANEELVPLLVLEELEQFLSSDEAARQTSTAPPPRESAESLAAQLPDVGHPLGPNAAEAEIPAVVPASLGSETSAPSTALDPQLVLIQRRHARDTRPPSTTGTPGLRLEDFPESAAPSFEFSPPSRNNLLDDAPPTHAQLDPFPVASVRREARPTILDLRPLAVSKVSPVGTEHSPFAGDAIEAVARAIRGRATGALEVTSDDGSRVRHIVLREGDVVTVGSSVEEEALVSMLVERGDLSAELVRDRASRLPRAGRHAAAALIAQGFLSQDDLWPVLRAHAEWCLVKALREGVLRSRLLDELPARLGSEPSVFGGATGVEVFVDVVRRTLDERRALQRIGGRSATFEEGSATSLLHEAALDASEVEAVGHAAGGSAAGVLDALDDGAALLAALVALDVLRTTSTSTKGASDAPAGNAALDAGAVRERIRTRLGLVHNANYFALLGVNFDATTYEIRRAYVELRRELEPSRLLTAETADLGEDVRLILDVLGEAYDVLRDDVRRGRYRRALGTATS